MSKDERNRVVQLLAVNPKYKERTGYITPVFDSRTKKFITGFDDSPAFKGKILKALGFYDEDDKQIPFENVQVPINHRQVLNLNFDEDYGIYKLCMVNTDIVAPSTKKVDAKKHLFFINDVEMEAKADISEKTQIFKAMQKVFDEADGSRLKSLCVYLGGIDIRNRSQDYLVSRVLEECSKRPMEVIAFYDGNVENKTFILELSHYAVIQFKQGKYMDGEVYLGTFDEMLVYIADPKNSSHVNSLGERLLKQKG